MVSVFVSVYVCVRVSECVCMRVGGEGGLVGNNATQYELGRRAFGNEIKLVTNSSNPQFSSILLSCNHAQEYELLFDDCPMRYYDARNPYIDINAALDLTNHATNTKSQQFTHLISALALVFSLKMFL